MTAICLEKLLVRQAQVVLITQGHKVNFGGYVCERSLSSGPLFSLLSGNHPVRIAPLL